MPYEPGVSVSKKIENSRNSCKIKIYHEFVDHASCRCGCYNPKTSFEGQPGADIQEDLEIILEKWTI